MNNPRFKRGRVYLLNTEGGAAGFILMKIIFAKFNSGSALVEKANLWLYLKRYYGHKTQTNPAGKMFYIIVKVADRRWRELAFEGPENLNLVSVKKWASKVMTKRSDLVTIGGFLARGVGKLSKNAIIWAVGGQPTKIRPTLRRRTTWLF